MQQCSYGQGHLTVLPDVQRWEEGGKEEEEESVAVMEAGLGVRGRRVGQSITEHIHMQILI